MIEGYEGYAAQSETRSNPLDMLGGSDRSGGNGDLLYCNSGCRPHESNPAHVPSSYPAGWSGTMAHLTLPALSIRLVGGGEHCWSAHSFSVFHYCFRRSPRMGRSRCLANVSAREYSDSLRWDVGRRTSRWHTQATWIWCNQVGADQYYCLGRRLALRLARGK